MRKVVTPQEVAHLFANQLQSEATTQGRNFYFNGKKVALHRLLYNNFLGDLDDSEYLKYNCENKGKCCNLNHFKRVIPENSFHETPNEPKDNIIDISSNKLKKNITVEF
jgi:hypothetical protein